MDRTIQVWALSFTAFREDTSLDLEALDAMADFYVAAGCAGVFALGATGEVHDLDLHERHGVVRRMARRLNGRCPLAATGNIHDTLEGQAEALRVLREQGADIPVIMTSLLPGQGSAQQLLRIAEKTEGPLGIYESFHGGHRTLTPEETDLVAKTGRFVFMKETTCDLPTYLAKVEASQGTPLRVFQANLERLPPSVEGGSPGFCGVVGAVYPDLVLQCCNASDASERKEAHQRLLSLQQAFRDHGYPTSGKYLLSRRGVPIQPISRAERAQGFSEVDRAALDEFFLTF
jgi:4-hydroxy-tetrahydrodipicolinate synthase